MGSKKLGEQQPNQALPQTVSLNYFNLHTYNFLLFLFAFVVSCGARSTSENANAHEVDTLYHNPYSDIAEERFLIKIAELDGNPVSFTLNEPSIVKIDIPGFNEYRTELTVSNGTHLSYVDTLGTVIRIIPVDTTFTIDIWLDFLEGNVVRKSYLSETEYEIIALSGNQFVGRLNLTAIRK